MTSAALSAHPGRAAPRARHGTAVADLPDDFHALAQQRPWVCRNAGAPAAAPRGWDGGSASCVWQERLRLREWQFAGSGPGAQCVSAQARWWTWARAGAGGLAVWRSAWTAASITGSIDGEQRVLILRRLPDGLWRGSEWRWAPSPRPATRRWQQGRWDLLVAAARQYQSAAPAQNPLWKVLEANIGARPGELGEQQASWLAEGMCLQVDVAAPGPQQLQLPYAADDSRLEQRAAMQLQLARRFPKATWLTPFSLVPAARHVKSGAKFYASWRERDLLNAQLWIPTKGDGPLVRVRISTALAAPGSTTELELARARSVVERELFSVAAQWALLNE